MTRPLAFVDVETTGLDPDLHDLWEIAVIIRAPVGGFDVEHLWQVTPDITTADPSALRINRFYERHRLEYARDNHSDAIDLLPQQPDHSAARIYGQPMPARKVAWHLARLLLDATIIGAAPHFDAAFITRFLKNHNEAPMWNHRLRCVETLTAAHLRRPDIGGLTDCCQALGLPHDDPHTALGDASAVRDIWDEIFNPAQVA